MDTNDDLRVKYYSTNDLSAGFYLKRIEDIICNFVVEKKESILTKLLNYIIYNSFSIIEFILYIGQNSS